MDRPNATEARPGGIEGESRNLGVLIGMLPTLTGSWPGSATNPGLLAASLPRLVGHLTGSTGTAETPPTFTLAATLSSDTLTALLATDHLEVSLT